MLPKVTHSSGQKPKQKATYKIPHNILFDVIKCLQKYSNKALSSN